MYMYRSILVIINSNFSSYSSQSWQANIFFLAVRHPVARETSVKLGGACREEGLFQCWPQVDFSTLFIERCDRTLQCLDIGTKCKCFIEFKLYLRSVKCTDLLNLRINLYRSHTVQPDFTQLHVSTFRRIPSGH
jgi:hypothetical protein